MSYFFIRGARSLLCRKRPVPNKTDMISAPAEGAAVSIPSIDRPAVCGSFLKAPPSNRAHGRTGPEPIDEAQNRTETEPGASVTTDAANRLRKDRRRAACCIDCGLQRRTCLPLLSDGSSRRTHFPKSVIAVRLERTAQGNTETCGAHRSQIVGPQSFGRLPQAGRRYPFAPGPACHTRLGWGFGTAAFAASAKSSFRRYAPRKIADRACKAFGLPRLGGFAPELSGSLRKQTKSGILLKRRARSKGRDGKGGSRINEPFERRR